MAEILQGFCMMHAVAEDGFERGFEISLSTVNGLDSRTHAGSRRGLGGDGKGSKAPRV